jgi:hypothetical protein
LIILCIMIEHICLPQQDSSDETRFRSSECGQWAEKHEKLCLLFQQKGHCLVRRGHQQNVALARWVKRQRYQCKLKLEGKSSTMTDERIQALESIGFVWDSQGASWYERFNDLKACPNGQIFKFDDLDSSEYNLLRGYWHVMAPEEKRKANAIVESFNNVWNAECIEKVQKDCSMLLEDMQNLRTCLSLARKQPEHFEYTLSVAAAPKTQEVVDVDTERMSINDGLDSFQLKPKG